MIIINGENVNAEGKTIGRYIDEKGFNREKIVVELNLEIISRDRLDTIVLKDGDKVEILNFVGGG